MKLSEHLVKSKARVSEIRSIKQLNIWGCQLTDISLFLQIPFIEILVLGNNQISSLYALKNCQSLKKLYLGKNLIESFEELKYLQDAKSLNLLCLRDNPCAVAAGNSYRISVLRMLPQLMTLDEADITAKEIGEIGKAGDRGVEDTNWNNRNNLSYQGAEQAHQTSTSAGISSPSSTIPSLNLPEHKCDSNNTSCRSGSFSPRHKAVASASACVNAVTKRREQELKDTISQYYTDAPEQAHRARNASLLMAALALAKQMDATTLEVFCRAIQDEVLKLPS